MWTRRQAMENMNYWGDSRVIEGMMNRGVGFEGGKPNWNWIFEQVTDCSTDWSPSMDGLEGEEEQAQSDKIVGNIMAYFLDMLRIKFPNTFAEVPDLEDLLEADSLDFPVCNFPMKWAICSQCDGDGSHVNPSIDCGGITQDEFDEDPEFAEAYFSGRYDVSCKPCGGSGKVKVMSASNNAFVQWVGELVEEHDRYEYEYAMEVAAERRFGC